MKLSRYKQLTLEGQREVKSKIEDLDSKLVQVVVICANAKSLAFFVKTNS